MKLLFITAIFVLSMNYSKCQTQYYGKSNSEENHEILTTQQVGYALTGMGAITIIYTAAKTSSVKNPTPWYIGGVALIGGGICLLVFGKKNPQPKYWKGMQGYLPKKTLRKDFFIPLLKFSSTSDFKAIGSANLKQFTRN